MTCHKEHGGGGKYGRGTANLIKIAPKHNSSNTWKGIVAATGDGKFTMEGMFSFGEVFGS